MTVRGGLLCLLVAAVAASGCGSDAGAARSENRTKDDKPADVIAPVASTTTTAAPTPSTTTSVNYRSCADAEAAGAAPIHRGEPGYSGNLDRDGDGVACDQEG